MCDSTSQDLRLLLPETVWLEPEHYLLAQETSSLKRNNANIFWQTYINTLGLLGFEVWLQKRLPSLVIARDISKIETNANLKVDQFKFCAIATEYLLDEIVNIPSQVIENPEFYAHVYVLIEVLEEEEQVIIRGFLSHNQLAEIKSNIELPIHKGCYQLPLSVFDIEPNHLLVYFRYVQASELASSVADSQVTVASEHLSNVVSTTTTKLSQWLQGVVGRDWQTFHEQTRIKFSFG